MNREWYLIDDEGIHPLELEDEKVDFWEQFDRKGDEAPWPAFNQLVLDASATSVIEALAQTAPLLGIELDEVTDEPERWAECVVIARADELIAIAEPGVELDQRAMALPWTEELIGALRCDGAFFGYDPEAGTLHLTMFEEGRPVFAWCDSLTPGPSYAMVFDDEGRCTDEDPRKFALRFLQMPETSPLLDRYRFVLANLEELGMHRVSPELDEFPIAAVMEVRRARQLTSRDS